MDKRQKTVLENLRNLLKHNFSDIDDENKIAYVRGLLLNTDENADINPHVRLVASHVLWHSVLKCACNTQSVFPPEQFPYVALEERISLLKIPKIDFLSICVINGFVNVASDELCLRNTKHNSADSCYLLDIIGFLLSNSVKYKPTDNYFHFVVLKNCLAKITKISLHSNFDKLYESALREFWNLCLNVVQCYWDSRYSGVSELTVEIFQSFTNFIFRFDNGFIDIERLLKSYINDYPYFVRGKFKIIGVLVEFLEFNQFRRIEDELLQIFRIPMHSTYLSPFVGTIYKTVLCYLSKYEMFEDVINRWLLLTSEFLCSLDRSLAFNAAKHFLPAVVKYLSSFFDVLKQRVILSLENAKNFELNFFEIIDIGNLTSVDITDQPESGEISENKSATLERAYWAFAVVLKYNIRIKGYVLNEEEKSFLSNGLTLRDDEIRIECFQTLFEPSSASGGFYTNVAVLEEFLLNNLTVSDSSFRRRMLTFFKKWLLYRLEENKKCQMFGFQSFLESLFSNLCANLFPCASYQRLATSLSLLNIMLDSLFEKYGSDFTTSFNVLLLSQLLHFVICIQNSSIDIRDVSFKILMNFVKFPLRLQNVQTFSVDEKSIFENLLKVSKTLCNSPKELDCESGSTLWKLLFKKYLLENEFSLTLDDTYVLTKIDEDSANVLCNFVKSRFENLKCNLKDASFNNPLHGYLVVLKTFLQVLKEEKFSIRISCANIVYALIVEISNHFLNVFGSSGDEECPSLEEMEIAVLSECTDSRVADNLDGYTDIADSLSDDKQLVLACCWLNIKDCARVGAQLILCTIEPYAEFILLLAKIGELFFQIMTRTRHWGVLDGCGEAFGVYCNFCFSNIDPNVRILPKEILTKILTHMAQPRSISVTRRAVGYPLMIQCIVVNSCCSKQTNLLSYTMECLFKIAKTSYDSESDGRKDIAIVRAIHCVRLLLRCSNLGQQVSPYVADCYELVLKYFSSPIWPLRNSVVLTLSAITWRLFGRRNVLLNESSETDTSETDNSVSKFSTTDIATNLCEFRSNFNDVWILCCERVEEIAVFWKGKKCSTFVDPSLFPVFIILQNLVYVPDKNTICLETEKNLDLLRKNLLYFIFHLSDSRLRNIAIDIFINFSTPKFNAEKFFSVFVKSNLRNRPSLNNLNALVNLHDRLEPQNYHLLDDDRNLKSNFLDEFLKQISECGNFKNIAHCCSPSKYIEFFIRIYRHLKHEKDLAGLSLIENSSFVSFLTNCCKRNYGISIQSLALPIYTNLVHSENTKSDEFWSDVVHSCSRENRNETCRYAAAYSFALYGPTVLFENNPISTKLFFDAVDLFLDEDNEIGEIMCYLLAKNSNLSKTANLCLKDLFDKVNADHLNLCKLLFDRFNVKENEFVELNSTFSEENSSTRTFLFKQKDFNIFREEFNVIVACYKTVERISEIAENKRKFLDKISGLDFRELVKNMNFGVSIISNVVKQPNFNFCCLENADKLLIPMCKLKSLILLFELKSEFSKFLEFCTFMFGSILQLEFY